MIGVNAIPIRVETDVSTGLPYFDMVGCLAGEVKEARERVRTALRNAGFQLEPRKIVVNLSPADIRKSGTSYDLSIAASVLGAYGMMPRDALQDTLIVGELGLDGACRPINGVLNIAMMAGKEGIRRLIVPAANAAEGAAAPDIAVYGVSTLAEMVAYLRGQKTLSPAAATVFSPETAADEAGVPDFADIHGQQMLKRCMEIAVSGMHHMMMVGPPGSGKSMAARRLPSIMPMLTREESLEITEIYSSAGLLPAYQGLVRRRPFRAPHHTATDIALAGGGRIPKPGEVSLAHRGVLFLDELTEFRSQAMETLRQPLESGRILISRAAQVCEFPADFMLVAAINPCRCGFFPDPIRCSCTPLQIQRYLGRISQPILDRIDMTVEVRPAADPTGHGGEEERSEQIRRRVEAARALQQIRYEGSPYLYNGQLNDRDIESFCPLGEAETEFMRQAYRKFELSARAYYKVIKVARTIADLDNDREIREPHLQEALFYKTLDRKYWGGLR